MSNFVTLVCFADICGFVQWKIMNYVQSDTYALMGFVKALFVLVERERCGICSSIVHIPIEFHSTDPIWLLWKCFVKEMYACCMVQMSLYWMKQVNVWKRKFNSWESVTCALSFALCLLYVLTLIESNIYVKTHMYCIRAKQNSPSWNASWFIYNKNKRRYNYKPCDKFVVSPLQKLLNSSAQLIYLNKSPTCKILPHAYRQK
jgi:hypothetical protein